jgi:nitrate reductase NapAB chaperone NapD
MARLDLNFHTRSRYRIDAFALALLVIGALAVAWVTSQWITARNIEAKQAAALLKLEHRAAPKRAVSRPDNAGWRPAFDALAATRSDKIALLSLNAIHAKRQIKLVAEARNLADAVAFIEALQQQPGVLRAVLNQHEIETAADQKPVRFQATVEWRA